MHRQIAGRLTGRVTKWIVLAFWLVTVVVAGTFAAKLTDVQNNEASSWLPASAESTKALEKLGPFQDPNAIPTLVVYERDSGLTEADIAAADGGRGGVRLGERRGRRDPGPVPVRGRPGPADGGDLQLRSRRLERHARRGRRPARHRDRSTAATSTSPEPVVRPPTRPRRSPASTRTCSSPPSPWSSSSCCSPTAARSCGSCRSSAPASRSSPRRPSSTSSRSTPTSPSTGRARRS